MTDSVPGKVESIDYKSKTDKFENEIICDPCEEDGESKPAEGFCVECQHYLCDECFHVHRQPKPLRHHRLLSKDKMPKKRVADSLSEICPEHEGELIKYYCKNHGTVGCNSCIITEHKSCQDISTLADLAKGVENSSQYREFCTRMTETNEELKRQIDIARQNVKVTETCCTDAIDQVNKLQEKLCKQFDVLRNQIIKEAKDMKKNDTERIQRLEGSTKSAKDEQKNLLSNMQILEETKQSKQLFVAIIKGKEKQKELEQRLEDVKNKNNVKRYCFIPNEFLMCMLQNIDALGELCNYEDGESLADLKSSYRNYPEYGITRGAPLSEKHCVILDTTYNSVKLYRKEREDEAEDEEEEGGEEEEKEKEGEEKIEEKEGDEEGEEGGEEEEEEWYVAVAEIKLSSCPWDATPIHENKFAVTLPNEKKIKVLSVTDENITESHDIKVDGRCEGIAYAYDEDLIFVTCNKPAKVLVLDVKGNVIRNICTDESGELLFQQPAYITYHEEQELLSVSDRKTGSVTFMTKEGTITHVVKHKKMKFPFSVLFSSDDDLFDITDYESQAFKFNIETGKCDSKEKEAIYTFVKKHKKDDVSFLCLTACVIE